jgi:hypothetical protein
MSILKTLRFQALQSDRKRKTNVLQFTTPCEHRIEWLCLNSQQLLVGGLLCLGLQLGMSLAHS